MTSKSMIKGNDWYEALSLYHQYYH